MKQKDIHRNIRKKRLQRIAEDNSFISISGNTLSVPLVSGFRYQWYSDGDLIPGEVSNTLSVLPYSNKNLRCKIMVGDTFSFSQDYKIPIPMDMSLWIDPSDLSTITMDSTIPTNLSSILDKSSNSLSATNTTSGVTQPIISLVNGRRMIEFVGTNAQFLTLGQPSALNLDITTATHTIFIVLRPKNSTGYVLSKSSNSATTRSGLYLSSSVSSQSFYGGTASGSAAITRDISNIVRWALNPTAQKIFSNGTELLSASSGVNTNTSDILIGARRNTTNEGSATGYTGFIGEILWYKRALTSTEITAVENYLTTKWTTPQTLLLVGASLENAMFTGLRALINTTYGVDWKVVNLAVSGENSTDIRNRIDTDLATHAIPGVYALVHAGGNDVSSSRPYRTAGAALTTLSENLSYIYNALRNAKVKILPCNLSFRDYDDTTVYYEEDSSKPYNDNIVQPTCIIEGPRFCYSDGTPYLDLYAFIKSNISYLQADNIHLTTTGYTAYRQFVVDTVVRKILTGLDPTKISSLPVPATPVLTTLTTTGTTMTGTWTMSSETNVTAYLVEHKAISDLDWTRSGTVTAPTKTLTISGLTNGVTYQVRVKSSTVNNAGSFSNSLNVTIAN